jgi:Protein of unknown function (DUF1292)
MSGSEGESAVVTLLDEAGAERRFVLHDAFDADGHTYYLVEAADDPEQVLLLRETEAGLESVEGQEFERVLTLLEADDPEGGSESE